MGGKPSKPATSEPPAAAAADPTKQQVKSGCCTPAVVGEDLSKYGMMPDNKRKCRDMFCCLFFIIFWIGMLIIGGIGLMFGKPQRLVYGTDYKGQVCGSDSDVQDAKYVAYPRTNEDFVANLAKKNPLEYEFYGVCAKACPKALDVICNYDVERSAPTGMRPVAPNAVSDATWADVKLKCMTGYYSSSGASPRPSWADCTRVKSNCWIVPQDTSSVMFRCIPVYNVTNAESTRCVYPAWVTSPYDPNCVVMQEDKAGSVQRPAQPNQLFDQLNSARQIWGRWFGDLARSGWVIVLCSVGLAILLGFVFVLFLKYFTACMVWTVIFSVILLLGMLTGYFYYKAGLINPTIPPSVLEELNKIPGKEQAAAAYANAKASVGTVSANYNVGQTLDTTFEQYGISYRGMAYAFTGVLIIVLCMVIAMRGAIRTAVEVIKLGSDALKALPSLLFFPLTNVLTIGLFLVWWVFVAACLHSAGQVQFKDLQKELRDGLAVMQARFNLSSSAMGNATDNLFAMPNVNGTVFADVPFMNYLIIYHVFGLLWTTQFIQGVATMTVAGAVSGWYFSRLPKEAEGNAELEKLRYNNGRVPICSSLHRTLRYYLGSIAFGSLLIAIIQFIRLIFAYIQQRLEKQAKDNSTLRFIMCCVQCCLKCLQSIVEVVTRNAYVYVALKGDSFCGAGRRVFSLIINHGSVFMVVNVLGEVIMFLGKVLIATSCAFGSYVLLDNLEQFKPGGANALTSTWLPTLVTLFFSYAVASGFMMIYDLSVDTVLVCYVTDVDENLERNKGDKKYAYPVHVEAGAIDARARVAAQEKAKAASKSGSSTVTVSGSTTSTAVVPAGAAPKI